jgi:hypothetical protein
MMLLGLCGLGLMNYRRANRRSGAFA